MIARMDRIETVFLRSEFTMIAPFLQEQGVIHVENVPLDVENHPGYLRRIQLSEEDSKELGTLESIGTLLKEALPLLSTPPQHEDIAASASELSDDGETALSEWRKKAQVWHRELRTLSRRKLNNQDNIEVLKNYAAMLRVLAPLLAEHGAVLGETARAMVLDGYSPDDLETLGKRLVERVGTECRIAQQRLGQIATSVGLGRNSVIAVVTHPKDKATAVTEVLQHENIAALHAPDEEVYGTSIEDALVKISDKIVTLETSLGRITSELDASSKTHGPKLAGLEQVISVRIAQLHVVDNFAVSQMITAVHGWVPSEDYDTLSSALLETFGDKAAIEKLPYSDVELRSIPTLLKNPRIVKPFELIMGLLNPPTYGTYDPTWLVALSFIIFYGFVLGDAGYGLIIVAIGAWAKKKWGHIQIARDGMTIFQWMGASSIVFGLIYLEFFGNFIERLTGWHALFHRANETKVLLVLAITIGMIHVPLSLLIGIREGFRHGHSKHVREKLALLLGLIALGVTLLSGSGAFPIGARTGYILASLIFSVALYYFVRSMGVMAPMGLLEIVGLFSNILSYSRLMALGVVSFAFADIANMLPEMFGGGAVGVLIGIPMALMVHTLNIGLGIFSPTIHSLRLNIVEFMPKFYEPEGTVYKPFRKELAW